MTLRPPRSSTLLITAIVVLAIAAAIRTVFPGGPATNHPAGPPTRLSTSAASIAAGQATATRFADAFAEYLNGTRDPRDLAAAGATAELVRAISATPDRREKDDPPSHYTAEGVLVRPTGQVLQLTATYTDGDLRIPLLATVSRVGRTWHITNLSASRD
jgi:hypothetical protein